jgi:hypothetical protein
VDLKTVGGEIYEKLIKPAIISTIDRELSTPIVLCHRGHEVKLDSVVKASDDVFEMVKYGFLNEEELRYIYNIENTS